MEPTNTDAKRIVGGFTVTHSFEIGDKEVILGENRTGAGDDTYLCGYAASDGIIERYTDCVVGDDYLEILEAYRDCIDSQIGRLQAERREYPDSERLTPVDCIEMSDGTDLNGKIVAVKPESLRPEYLNARHQLMFVTGGFGASPHSRGNAVFGKRLSDGEAARWDRRAILGEVKEDCLPKWATERLDVLRGEQEVSHDSYEIHQLQDTRTVAYAFCSYREARPHLKREDYQLAYKGKLEQGMTLDAIFALHNADERPNAKTMRSASVSDVIVMERDGKKSAHYIDSAGFKGIPQFLGQEKQKHKDRGDAR